MRALIWVLAVILVGSLLAGLAKDDPGFAILGYGHWTIEMSLALFTVITLLCGTAIYYSIRLLINIKQTPSRLHRWSKQSGARKASRKLSQGLTSQAQGEWKKAEKRLTSNASDSKHPGLHYLIAARSAQAQGAPGRRDHYLQQALKFNANDIAVLITQAELQMNEGQMELALATLLDLRRKAPKNDHVLRLLASVYRRQQDWQALSLLLADLKNKRIMPDRVYNDLETRTFRKLLEKLNSNNDMEALHQNWHRLPRHLRKNPALARHYCDGLIRNKRFDEAERQLRECINQQWDEELVHLYGFCLASKSNKQLETAERWLNTHENNAILLLTLGHLCMRMQLWGKARAYLESSLASRPMAKTHYSLAKLLDALGEQTEAAQHYQQGLDLNYADQADFHLPDQVNRIKLPPD